MAPPPTTPEEFREMESEPGKSFELLKSKTGDLGSGSSWTRDHIMTFRAIRPRKRHYMPPYIEQFIKTASDRVKHSQAMQTALSFAQKKWRPFSHQEIEESAGPLAAFFTLLGQVLEMEEVAEPTRELRPRHNAPDYMVHNSDSDSSSEPGSKPRHSSESFHPDDQSDQSGCDKRAKSENVTNACVYELLRCATERSRKPDDHDTRLEWATAHNTMDVNNAKWCYTTIDDGNLVQRDRSSGRWQRASADSPRSFCGIEAKSWFNIEKKSSNVQGQELAHLVAMFDQCTRGNPTRKSITIPLVSCSQNLFSLVLGRFPDHYRDFLETGDFPETRGNREDNTFVEIEESLTFNLLEPKDLEWVFVLIVALVLKQQSLLTPAS